ncbi:hypothetical protein JCM30471_31790 [Desulfuromonas carbonis]|uniref:sensor histidine kinase n=1 Tax=Desulfuromonas sp. DDH964 TaxID=1823759 RepID=UPI00078E6D83|nr:ATP-binding protein [Desulfuromonas sp. DDH964]AMV71342.1 phosphate sensor histidine kinase, HAMP and PAS domain-containing [Desulfuromonas sp. DDH964]
MPKDSLLKKILILSFLMAGLFPLYQLLYIHPAYQELLVEETEDEAERFARYLVRTLHLDQQDLAPGSVPELIGEEVGQLQDDALLRKLRLFGPSGTILYSTVPEEVGEVNAKPYFRDVVARGQRYSKVVEKNDYTAEGQRVRTDVVETYVPIMGAGRFRGAVETYYDITASRQRVALLTRHSFIPLALICGGFLLAVLLLSRKASQLLTARAEAEEALYRANDLLEGRVAERTRELLLANEKLNAEVAERTLAQMALAGALEDSREGKQKLDAILSSVDDGLLAVDGEGRVLLVNPAAEVLFGIDQEAVGRPLCEVLQPSTLRDTVCGLLPVGETIHQFDFELAPPGQEQPRVFQGRTSQLFLGELEDAGPGMIILIQDVSHERAVERMKSEFLAMAAHELQTPLTTIVGYSELLSTAAAGAFSEEQQREFLGYLYNKAIGLSRIVDDLLDISRIEAGQSINLQHRPFALTDILKRVVGQYRQQGSHPFELEIAGAEIELIGDPGRVEQVLENLLSNAVKYSPAGGTVRIVAGVRGSRCVIRVSDEGIGMTPEQADRVFETFYRADASDTAIRGTGLGLSVAKHLVDAHGGELQVQSEIGKGTTMIVSLPLAPAE